MYRGRSRAAKQHGVAWRFGAQGLRIIITISIGINIMVLNVIMVIIIMVITIITIVTIIVIIVHGPWSLR